MMVSAEETGPVNMSHNNIGTIVTVDLDANAVASSNIEASIMSVILGILNHNGAAGALTATGQES